MRVLTPDMIAAMALTVEQFDADPEIQEYGLSELGESVRRVLESSD